MFGNTLYSSVDEIFKGRIIRVKPLGMNCIDNVTYLDNILCIFVLSFLIDKVSFVFCQDWMTSKVWKSLCRQKIWNKIILINALLKSDSYLESRKIRFRVKIKSNQILFGQNLLEVTDHNALNIRSKTAVSILKTNWILLWPICNDYFIWSIFNKEVYWKKSLPYSALEKKIIQLMEKCISLYLQFTWITN